MEDKPNDPAIRDVIREEQARGRRRTLDMDEVRRQRETRQLLGELIEARDLKEAVNALRESGRSEALIERFVTLWNELLR